MRLTLNTWEWLRSTTGLLGAFLPATNSPVSAYGFVAFFLSNARWLETAGEL